jgi:hypothetical protein
MESRGKTQDHASKKGTAKNLKETGKWEGKEKKE